ncbi:hypothetical protein F4809DRAFT_661102 [Biscogniauxia mediterranea]|nr:hypothetical protein F4809DRAFT_661102 [Biscogniauxia mediterranea]
MAILAHSRDALINDCLVSRVIPDLHAYFLDGWGSSRVELVDILLVPKRHPHCVVSLHEGVSFTRSPVHKIDVVCKDGAAISVAGAIPDELLAAGRRDPPSKSRFQSEAKHGKVTYHNQRDQGITMLEAVVALVLGQGLAVGVLLLAGEFEDILLKTEVPSNS